MESAGYILSRDGKGIQVYSTFYPVTGSLILPSPTSLSLRTQTFTLRCDSDPIFRT